MGKKPIQGASMGKRSIGGAIGATVGVIEIIGAAWNVGGKMFGWLKRLFNPTKKFYIWKLGDAERPVGPKEIEDFENQLTQVSEGKGNTLVTHHAVYLHVIDIDSKGLFEVIPVEKSDPEPPKVGFVVKSTV